VDNSIFLAICLPWPIQLINYLSENHQPLMKKLKYFFITFSFIPIFVFAQLQGSKKIDSLKSLYDNSTDVEERVELLRKMFNIQLYIEPNRSEEYALEILSIGQDYSDKRHIALAKFCLGNYHYIKHQHDSATIFYQKAIDISLKNGYETIHTNSLSGLANVMADNGNYPEAIKLHKILAEKYEKSKNFLNYGIMLGNVARCNYHLGNYPESMRDYLAAIRTLDTIPREPFRKADILRDIGRLSYIQANHEESLDYFEKALSIYERTEDNLYQAYTLNDMANTYDAQNLNDKALEYYLKSLVISRENNYVDNEANTLGNIGSIYKKKGEYEIALKHLKRALQLDRKHNTKDNVVSALNEIGHTYSLQNDHENALKFLNEAATLADSIGNMEGLTISLHYRSWTYENNGKLQLALKDFKKSSAINDSLFNIGKSKQIEELKTIYQTEKKEAEIALQEEEIKTLNEKARGDKLQKGLFAGGMASALALFALSVFGFRQRIKKNRIAREKQEEIYKQEIEHKQKELASQTLHLVQKNTFIQELKENLENLKNSPEKFKAEFRRIVMLLKKENASDKDWEVFKTYFADVHNDFDQKLKTLYADISEKEIRLAAFLRMNLTTKEIAATLNVLPDSILKSKYRLKKKLELDKETDLNRFLSTL